MSEEIEDLQVKLAHQERAISELSDQVRDQWREIERLKNFIKGLDDRFQNFKEDVESGEISLSPSEFAAKNKPPHY